MKAVRIIGPSQVRIEDVPIQEPAPNEVLVEVKAVGLCGTDYEIYTNDLVYIRDGRSKLPIVPGHEWSGVVRKTGNQVTRFNLGDHVTGECTVSCGTCVYCQQGRFNQCINRTETGIMNRDGGFAEFITFPESHLHAFRNISFAEAALIEPTGIAWYALNRAQVTEADYILVSGPGPVGLQAAQIARKVCLAKKVILSGTRDERLARSHGYGLDGIINIRRENIIERVAELTDGHGVDVVIEASGGEDVFQNIDRIINPCGRVVLVGFFGTKQPRIDWDSFITRDISIIGSLGSPGVWAEVIAALESGRIETKSLISHRLRLTDFEQGLDMMVNRKDNACKIILEP